MPSATPNKRHASEDDADSLSQASSSSASQNKRARVQHRNGRPNRVVRRDADLKEEEGEEDEEDEEEDKEEEDDASVEFDGGVLPEANVDVDAEQDILALEYDIAEDEDTFLPGAIVRIALENFLTYSAVEIRPGPNLNIVIGPNGTGKSTIVCAICLGLGWSPAHLGRAKEVGEFVKHGSQEGFIEIELQGKPGERNPVIKRKILRENNSSTWYLNRKSSTLHKVVAYAKSYNIQIDNLCQFLPQDRVVEFSNLPHTELLKETQRAAAGPEMLKSHNELIKLWKEVSDERTSIAKDKEQLQQLESRQAVLQQDVDRLRERQEVMARIELLQKSMPFIKYRESREESVKAKSAAKAAERELAKLKAQMGPAMERPRQKKRYKEAVQAVLRERQVVLGEMEEKVARQKSKVIPKLEEKGSEITKRIDAERNSDNKRREDIKKLRKQIEDAKKRLEGGPPEIDLTHYHKLINEKGREIRSLTEQSGEIRTECDGMIRHGTQVKQQIQFADRQIEQLESVSGQREALLQQQNKDAWQAWRWYQEHKAEFEEEIFGPAILSCSVTNPQFVDIVEAIIGGSSIAFLCQNSRDYYKFMNEVIGNSEHRGLGLANVTVKDFSRSQKPLLQDQSRVSPELLAQLGFNATALDYIDGPEPVLNMLCHDCHINATPVSAHKFDEAENKRCEYAGLNIWAAGKTIYRCTRRYGAQTTRVTDIPTGKMFRTQKVDSHKKSEIQKKISELQYQLGQIDADLKKRNADFNDVKRLFEEAKKEKQDIENEKNAKHLALQKYNKLQAELGISEDRLKEKIQLGNGYKETIRELELGLDRLVMDRAQAAIGFSQMVGELVDIHNDLVKLRLRYIEAASDEKILASKNEHIIRMRAEKERQYEELGQRFRQLRNQASKDREELNDSIANLSVEDREKISQTPPEKTLADVEDEIDTEHARLGLIHEGNPNVIKQYEERAAKIAGLQKKIDRMESQIEGQCSAIEEVRSVWEPQVDALIAKISAAFSKSFQKVGCAGEVRVFKSEEGFEKWAVEIMVKFRENEKLQVLNSQRQSGGERAVSTVFYLMALQSLAQSPFRVVDEINQGMDPRNERVVHHRIFNIACQEHTSQYFLITPKLLSGLIYHPRMKIHCIYSGDWVQEDSVMDFGKYLAVGRKLNRKPNGVRRARVDKDGER